MKDRTRRLDNPLAQLSATELKDALTGVTIGGNREGVIDVDEKRIVFQEYFRRAFPKKRVISVEPITTAASLNSVSAVITIKEGLRRKKVFGKVHIESNTKSISALGADQEYAMADMLSEAGWPVLKPLEKSKNSEYPLLLYPVVEAEPLFDKLERSYLAGNIQITDQELESLAVSNQLIGEQEVMRVRVGTREDAINAPVQNLLLKRFEQGGRIDQWYTPDRIFALPGLDEPISWTDLLDKKWNINGRDYDMTIRQIVEQARKSLAFEDEEQAFLTILHGDDHAGNVRITNPPVVFDPAFAGWNPAALDVKALAHTGFLPMAAMYYPPKGLETTYQISGGTINLTTNLEELPMFQTQEMLAKQIIDARVLLVIKRIKDMGGDITKEKERIKSGLAACALLTVDIAKLLKEGEGKATGLLPMAVMFASLQGLPMLEYLERKIEEL